MLPSVKVGNPSATLLQVKNSYLLSESLIFLNVAFQDFFLLHIPGHLGAKIYLMLTRTININTIIAIHPQPLINISCQFLHHSRRTKQEVEKRKRKKRKEKIRKSLFSLELFNHRYLQVPHLQVNPFLVHLQVSLSCPHFSCALSLESI